MKQRSQPNVVFIVADDHESRAMRWAGCSDVQTPHLDALAARGSAFTRAYHCGGNDDAVCIPTRASLLTGMDCKHSMRGGRGVLDPDRTTLPECFKRANYFSYITGKWHNDHASLARSFDDGATIFSGGMHDHYNTPIHPFDPSGAFPETAITNGQGFSVDLFTDSACTFIENYQREQPFFLYTAFTAPHDPRTPPAEFAARYAPASLKLPENYAPEHPFDLGVREIRDERLAPYPRTEPCIREALAAYYGMITAMDAGIGRIVQALEASGQLENTLIVYTADHGLAVGQHGLLGKQNVYEHSARVPLLISGPNIPKGQISNALTYSWDSYATLCELCQISAPEGLQSQSLVPSLQKPQQQHRPFLCSQYTQSQRMIVENRWKLICTRDGEATRTQLFDLSQDPWEQTNLSTDDAYQTHIDRLSPQLLTSSLSAV